MRGGIQSNSPHHIRFPQPDPRPAGVAAPNPQPGSSSASSSPNRRRGMLDRTFNPARLAAKVKNLVNASVSEVKGRLRGQADQIARQLANMTPGTSQRPDACTVKQLASNIHKCMTKDERRSLRKILKKLSRPEDQQAVTVLAGLYDAIRRGGQPGESSIAASLIDLENVAIKQKVDSAIDAEITELSGRDGDLALYFLAEEKRTDCNALSNIADQELACRGLLEILTLPEHGTASSDTLATRVGEREHHLTSFNPAEFVQDWKAARNNVETHLRQLEARVQEGRIIESGSPSIADSFQAILKMDEKPQLQLSLFKAFADRLEHVHLAAPESARGRFTVESSMFANLLAEVRPGEPTSLRARIGAPVNTPRQPEPRFPRPSVSHGEASSARGGPAANAAPAIDRGVSGSSIDHSAVFAARGNLFIPEIQPR